MISSSECCRTHHSTGPARIAAQAGEFRRWASASSMLSSSTAAGFRLLSRCRLVASWRAAPSSFGGVVGSPGFGTAALVGALSEPAPSAPAKAAGFAILPLHRSRALSTQCGCSMVQLSVLQRLPVSPLLRPRESLSPAQAERSVLQPVPALLALRKPAAVTGLFLTTQERSAIGGGTVSFPSTSAVVPRRLAESLLAFSHQPPAPNKRFEGTACRRGRQVPSALRAPAAPQAGR